MAKINTLCFNLKLFDSSYSFKVDEDSHARDVLQKENSAKLHAYIAKQLNRYYVQGYSYTSVLTETANSLTALLNDYCQRINTKYPDDIVVRHRELILWEDTTLSILSLQNRSNNFRIYFTQELSSRIRDLCLKKRVEMYDLRHIHSLLDNSGLASITKSVDKMTDSAGVDYLKKMHNRQYMALRRALPEADVYTLRMGQILFVLETISVSMPELNFSDASLKYFNESHQRLWKQVTRMETALVNRQIRKCIKEQQRTNKKDPKILPFSNFVSSDHNIAQVSGELRKLLKDKKGKHLAKVMCAAKDAGIISDPRIPFSTLQQEFGVCGAASGYYKYVSGDNLQPAEYRFLSEHLKTVFR